MKPDAVWIAGACGRMPVTFDDHMRPRYKNKRDQYKAELEAALKREKEANDTIYRERMWRQEADAKREKENKARYSATVYCMNCMIVSNVSIPPGVTIQEGDCVVCRVRGKLLPVKTYPNKI